MRTLLLTILLTLLAAPCLSSELSDQMKPEVDKIYLNYLATKGMWRPQMSAEAKRLVQANIDVVVESCEAAITKCYRLLKESGFKEDPDLALLVNKLTKIRWEAIQIIFKR